MLSRRLRDPRAAWLLAFAVAGCATAGESADDDDDDDDVVMPDARPGQPDARRPPPGTPDAAPPPPTIDAMPPPPTIDAMPPPPTIDAMPPPTGVCSADTSISCGASASDSLAGATDSVSGYACTTLDALEDHIYSFTPPTTGSVTITLDVVDDDPLFGDDLDLYVMSATCDPAACAWSGTLVGDESVTFTATAGTFYFVAVETYAAGLFGFLDYTLSVSCP